MATKLPNPRTLTRPDNPAALSKHQTDFLSGLGDRQPHNSADPASGLRSNLVSNRLFKRLSDLDMPKDKKELYRICRYLSVHSAVHKAIITANSTFPITDLIVKNPERSSQVLQERKGSTQSDVNTASEDRGTRKIAGLVEKHWRMKRFNQELAKSYYTYSCAIGMISYPFQKNLTCPECDHTAPASTSEWRLQHGGKFHWKCPECGTAGRALVTDQWLDIPEEVRLVVLDMARVDAHYNEWTRRHDVYYEVSDATKERLAQDTVDKEFVCTLPQAYLEAAMGGNDRYKSEGQRPRVKLHPDRYYIFAAPTVGDEPDGLPIPELVATLHEYWLLQLLLKSQEAIASDYIIPLRVVFPEQRGGTGNIFEMFNVSKFMDVIRAEKEKHKQDPNYLMVSPLPLGHQTIGGEAKALNLAQEIRIQMETIAVGGGSPLEFVFGGLSYSGSNVSIQQQEKKFADLRSNLQLVDQWVLDSVTSMMGLPERVIEQKSFRMGDDLQHLQMMSAMQASGNLSVSRIHDELGVDTESERQAILRDNAFQIEVQQARMKAEAEGQEDAMIRQATAQAAGMIEGTAEELRRRQQLQEAVRNDTKIMSLLRDDPQRMMMIFGPNAPESKDLLARGEVPTTPNPEEMAPGGGEQQMASLTPEQLTEMVRAEEKKRKPRVSPGDLASEFQNIPRADWATGLTHIRQQFGETVATAVRGYLSKAQAHADAEPETLPSRRAQ